MSGTGVFRALGAGSSPFVRWAGPRVYWAGCRPAQCRWSSALQRGAAQQVQQLLRAVLAEPAGAGPLACAVIVLNDWGQPPGVPQVHAGEWRRPNGALQPELGQVGRWKLGQSEMGSVRQPAGLSCPGDRCGSC